MRKLVLALVLAICCAATVVSGQVLQTFKYAHLYNNGTLHLVFDPGDAGATNPSVQLALILRRSGVWDRSAAKELPEWVGFSSPLDPGSTLDAAPIRYQASSSSPSRPDSQRFDIAIYDHTHLPYSFDIGYRLNINGIKGPWFYETAVRITDPVSDPTGTMSFNPIACDGSSGERIAVSGTISADPVNIRMEIWDSTNTVWVPLSNGAGGEWATVGWNGFFVGNFYAPETPITTDGTTRFYVLTKDNTEHGPVSGPVMTSTCTGIIIE